MEKILQALIPTVIGILAIFFYGRKVGLSKANKVQDKAEEEIEKAYEETAEAKAEISRAKTEADIMKNTVKIITAHDQDDNNTLKEKAMREDVDVSALVSEIIASSRAKAQEAEKRYEKN